MKHTPGRPTVGWLPPRHKEKAITRPLIPHSFACAALFAGMAMQTAQTPAKPSVKPALMSEGLAGYISMAVPAPPEGYGYGVSLYATAWPLLERPLGGFQIGLASIWIVPDNREVNYPLLPTGTVARDNWPERGPSYRDVFQTIEGGLGFWASTRFGSATAKFRMNGTPDGYNHEISSPGWGFGDTRPLPDDQMGIAQLSPRLLVPPDGLTFRKGTCGDLLGYAWMVLPLIPPKSATAGWPVASGGQCWTMFLNAGNFRGPVAFYTPATWSRISLRHPPAIGRGLDARAGLVTGGAIEINTVPRLVARDASGTLYSRIPRLQFPVDSNGRTVLIHNLTHYSRLALYNDMESWLSGGNPASGRFDTAGAVTPPCATRPLSVSQAKLPIRGCDSWVETRALGPATFGLQWKPAAVAEWSGAVRRGTFPEYCRQDGQELKAVLAGAVPRETGLKDASFEPARAAESYVSPESADSVWKRPGPSAGPCHAKLSDGSVVTYYWYRFIDQPALQHANLSAAEKNRLQTIAEKIHARWTIEKEYMAPPGIGSLATLDSALIVKPPKGMEVGYVPIVTRQSPVAAAKTVR